jgi:hypothetical protein
VGTDPHADVPDAYELKQNYPNPFNPTTAIAFGLPRASAVTLTIFNALGQEVARPLSGVRGAGYHEVQFDASGLATGVFFYRLDARPDDGTASSFVATKRFMLIR